MSERIVRMFEASPAILWAYDEVNGKMLYLNPTIEEILGYPVNLFYDNPLFWFEIIHIEDRKMVSALNAEMRLTKKNITYTARYRKADGAYVELLTTVRPILDTKGHIVRTEGAAIPTV